MHSEKRSNYYTRLVLRFAQPLARNRSATSPYRGGSYIRRTPPVEGKKAGKPARPLPFVIADFEDFKAFAARRRAHLDRIADGGL